MKLLRFCSVLFVMTLVQSPSMAQVMSLEGRASVAFGNNAWTGITNPGGMQDSNGNTIENGMNQQDQFSPTWVEVWGRTSVPWGWISGERVSWMADIPVPGGTWHCIYTGTVSLSTAWGIFTTVWVDYTGYGFFESNGTGPTVGL